MKIKELSIRPEVRIPHLKPGQRKMEKNISADILQCLIRMMKDLEKIQRTESWFGVGKKGNENE